MITIVEYCFDILIPCLVYNSDTIHILYEFPKIGHIFSTILLNCNFEKLRKCFAQAILTICNLIDNQ